MYQHYMIKCLPCKTHNWGTKTGVQKQYLSIKNDHSGYVLFVEYQRILKNIKIHERNIGNILQRQCQYCFIITAAKVLKVSERLKQISDFIVWLVSSRSRLFPELNTIL